ncbi:transcriptional regulator Myc-2-like isoform X2 [Perca flavescens]|uniref:transcriptional regulator Myc-2-like isoform X2 n=1 Tax=Perca flavescens TaxID=8167 RepID=UPI00106E2B91|nr:transcriptional regulator Myc-2-like isoform X2 [Perca flavescens]
MPPVLPVSCGNYDYDYDTLQPYFFVDGEEEDFYPPPRSQLVPGPGEDIWKKFELLPTPPLSPSRRPSLSDASLSAAEHLEAVSDLLGERRVPSAAFLQSFIIQDCMWSSSFAAATKLEKAVSERLASLRARQNSSGTDSANGDAADDQQVSSSRVNPGYLQDLHTAATDCIDPSVVFPFTSLREKSIRGAATKVEPELCLDSPPLTSSDSESEDEEAEEKDTEEEEEEEEDEDEIDVVTVDRRRASRRPDPVTSAPLVLKRCHVNIHQHNYAAQQPSVALQPALGKRMKSDSSGGGSSPSTSPRSDSGSDDHAKRRTHNVLERQRRNELKMSFVALRDEVPAVAGNDKAAKVAILKTATEFISEIREDERKLVTAKDALRKRSRELKHRLKQLRKSH